MFGVAPVPRLAPPSRVCFVAKSVASVDLDSSSLSKEVVLVARVIVLPNTEHFDATLSGQALLDERVDPVALEDEHSSLQFIERVAWAIEDAERMEWEKLCTTP
jgi:hypothetical protein